MSLSQPHRAQPASPPRHTGRTTSPQRDKCQRPRQKHQVVPIRYVDVSSRPCMFLQAQCPCTACIPIYLSFKEQKHLLGVSDAGSASLKVPETRKNFCILSSGGLTKSSSNILFRKAGQIPRASVSCGNVRSEIQIAALEPCTPAACLGHHRHISGRDFCGVTLLHQLLRS